MRWAQITVLAPPESVEAVNAGLTASGCSGVAELSGRPSIVRGFVPPDDDERTILGLVQDICARLPECGLPAVVDVSLDYVDERDWANEWKKHFKPTQFGRRIIVKPTWEPYDGAPGQIVLELDPGMAFGTGGHPTTRLCLEALEQLVQPGMRVADVGTGSGILAMAAAALGASQVDASEIDALPRRIASENINRSAMGSVVRVLSDVDFAALAGRYDLMVVNIVPDVIMALLPDLVTKLEPGAVFLTSGIVDERAQDVADALLSAGLHVREIRELEVWRALIAEAPRTSDAG